MFGPTATQSEVYAESCEGIVDSVLNGYNATVFAYGATGSGKTHTMMGNDRVGPGIMGLALCDMWQKIEMAQDEFDFEVSVSCLEVYNEMVYDLFTEDSSPLEMRQGQDGHYVVSKLSVLHPRTVDEVQCMLMEANKRRRQSPTDANQESSRSHAVFQITVTKKPKASGVTTIVLEGKLNLIDLAGSERASKTNNRSERMREGANINTSLLALGRCITALGENYRTGKYIPFRDSKLTRLLKDSLGGNCKTTMIAAISPSSLSYEDTYNTLNYAKRTRNIKINAARKTISVHTSVGQLRDKVEALNAQNAELRARLREAELKQSSCSCIKTQPPNIQELVSRVQQLYSVQKKIFSQLLAVDARIAALGSRAGDDDDDDDDDGKSQKLLSEAREQREKLVSELGYNEKGLSLVFDDILKLPLNVREVVVHEVHAAAHEAFVAQNSFTERWNTTALRLLSDITATGIVPVDHPFAGRIRSFLMDNNRTSGFVYALSGRALIDSSVSPVSSLTTVPIDMKTETPAVSAVTTTTTTTTTLSQRPSPVAGINLKRTAEEAQLTSSNSAIASKRVARFGGDEVITSTASDSVAPPVRFRPATSFLRPGVSFAPSVDDDRQVKEDPMRPFITPVGQRFVPSDDAAAFMPTETDGGSRRMPQGILKKASSTRVGESSRSVKFSSDVKPGSDTPHATTTFISSSPMPHPPPSSYSSSSSSSSEGLSSAASSFGQLARRLNAFRGSRAVSTSAQSFEVPPFRRQAGGASTTSAFRSTTTTTAPSSSSGTTSATTSSSRTASMFQPLSSAIGQSSQQQQQ